MLTTEEILHFMQDDLASSKKQGAKVGQRYYDGEHDILQYRMYYYNADGQLVEDKTRTNSRICHPFFTEHVDQLAAYIMSFMENPIRAKKTAEGLQERLDAYFDDEFWGEMQDLITGTNAKGFEYLYGFKNKENRLAFKCADSLGVIEVRAKDTDAGCEHIIYWYTERIAKGNKQIKKIEVYDKDNVWFYNQVDDGEIVLDEDEEINPRPNVLMQDEKGTLYQSSLGFIPFWRLDNNRKQTSGLKPIKGLIDDYDLMECGLSNNVQDFDTPIHLVKGFDGDNLSELQQNIKTTKIMGAPENAGIDILTVDIPYQARKTKADEDEKNIYRFGMAFNSAQSGDGNITNIVLKSRYTLLDLKAGKLIRRIKQFLKPIIEVVIDEINDKEKTGYTYKDVFIVFEPVVPTNEAEDVANAKTKAETQQIIINTILNVAVVIGEEQAIKLICDELELDYEDIQRQLEEQKSTQNAQSVLDGVVIDDEQTAKAGTTTVFG